MSADPPMRAEWKGGPAFAEVAEALRIRTQQILAMTRRGQGYVVLFTPAEDGSGPIWAGLVERDEDEVCFARTQHRTGETAEDWIAQMSKRMEQGL